MSLEAILAFFASMENWQKLLWVATVLIFCFSLEYLAPLARFDYKKWRHAAANLTLFGFTLVINFLFGFLILATTEWTAGNQFGLLAWVDLPLWLELLIAVMMLDLFAQYTAHYLLHHVPLLFKFHRIHHSDTKVDATTATRHHPGDYVVREIIALGVMFALGAPLSYYVLYRMLTVFFGYTSHANINLPLWIDRSVGWVLITPNIHKFHHHQERHWTDTNFGNIFSFWDRLFGTLVIDDPKKVQFGLDIMDDERDEDLVYQLTSPFDSSIRSDNAELGAR